MNSKLKIGDLVGIKSSYDNKLIKDCPPGLVILITTGYPLSPEVYSKKRMVATILWQDGVENCVDIEWLIKIK